MRAVVTALWQRAAARLPPRLQNGLFELALRALTVSAARAVTQPVRFALSELLLVRRVARYKLRRSGHTLLLRHPVSDAWVVHEVVNRDAYVPPAPVDRALGQCASARIVDLGAHIGAVTLAMLARYPSARVLALEPHPETAALLRQTIADNGLDAQCEVRQAAAGVAAGTAAIEGASLLAHLVREDTEEAIDLLPPLRKYQTNGVAPARVDVVDVLPLLDGADLVKMDIEGAEWPILQDPRFAALDISALVLEYHPQGAPDGDTTAAVRRLLGDAGFRLGEPFQQHGQVGLMWAWRA